MAAQLEIQRDFETAELDGSENLALDVPAEEAPGAEKIPGSPVPVAVIPDWRLEQLRDKYDEREPPEPIRDFYSPFG